MGQYWIANMQRLFFLQEPVNKMPWTETENTSLSCSSTPLPTHRPFIVSPLLQSELLLATLAHPHCQSFPPELDYKIKFAKAWIQTVQDAVTNTITTTDCEEEYEVDGTLMGMFMEWVCLPALESSSFDPHKPIFKTHILDIVSPPLMFTLIEDKSLISTGTTGLRTW